MPGATVQERDKTARTATRKLDSTAVRRYSWALHRYLLRRVNSAAEADDLIQETFERFLRVKVSHAIHNPLAYLFRIASHVVSDSLTRTEQNIVSYDSQGLDERAELIEGSDSDNVVDQVAVTEGLHRALARLPAMHRAVLLLIVREGLSHAQVATRTGLAVSTVGLYACEARARIRAALAE